MKKVIVLGALGLISLASCKKDYTCSCQGDNSGTITLTINNQKESEAEKICDDAETTYKGGDATIGCELQES